MLPSAQILRVRKDLSSSSLSPTLFAQLLVQRRQTLSIFSGPIKIVSLSSRAESLLALQPSPLILLHVPKSHLRFHHCQNNRYDRSNFLFPRRRHCVIRLVCVRASALAGSYRSWAERSAMISWRRSRRLIGPTRATNSSSLVEDESVRGNRVDPRRSIITRPSRLLFIIGTYDVQLQT